MQLAQRRTKPVENVVVASTVGWRELHRKCSAWHALQGSTVKPKLQFPLLHALHVLLVGTAQRLVQQNAPSVKQVDTAALSVPLLTVVQIALWVSSVRWRDLSTTLVKVVNRAGTVSNMVQLAAAHALQAHMGIPRVHRSKPNAKHVNRESIRMFQVPSRMPHAKNAQKDAFFQRVKTVLFALQASTMLVWARQPVRNVQWAATAISQV
jgi:hypothetical protein